MSAVAIRTKTAMQRARLELVTGIAFSKETKLVNLKAAKTRIVDLIDK